MLSRGLKDQIYNIFQALPYDSMQTMVVSATMPLEALEITKSFLHDPIRILLPKEEIALNGIKQVCVCT